MGIADSVMATGAALLVAGVMSGCDSGSGSERATDQPVVTSTATSSPSGVPDLGAWEELAHDIDVPRYRAHPGAASRMRSPMCHTASVSGTPGR
jgi:hypothetical protein